MQVMWWWLFAVWSLAWARRDPDDTIVFPGPVRDRRRSTPEPPGVGLRPPEGCRTSRCATNNSTIPLSLVQQLNEVSDLNELVERFITNKEDYYESLAVTAADSGGLALRFGNDGTPKAIQAKIPECIPQPSLVFVEPEDSEAGSLLLPSCIRVDRCSGCCHSPALECQPTREDELLYKISVLGLSYNGMLKFRHSRTVNVRKHIKCKCGCRIKQEDCNAMQVYRPDLCQCECPGADREACDSQFDRFWEETSCSCQCLAETDCSTGTFFDKAICRCRKYS